MSTPLNSVSQIGNVQILDDFGGPALGLLAANLPPLSWALAGPYATMAWPPLVDLPTIISPYQRGGVKERSGGIYRLDYPDEMFAGGGAVTVWGEAPGKRVLVHQLEVRNDQLVFPAADPTKVNCYFTVYDGNLARRPNVSFSFKLLDPKTPVNVWTTLPLQTAISDAQGVVHVLLGAGMKYRRFSPDGKFDDFNTGHEGTFNLPDYRGDF